MAITVRLKLMKLCFSTLGCSDRSLDQILSLAKNYRIPAIEIRGIDGVLDNSQIKVFSKNSLGLTSETFKAWGISPIVLGTSCSFHSPEKYEKAVFEGITSIKIAESLGAPYIRVFGDRLTEGSTDRIISGLSELCSVSPKVSVLLEVHGDYNTEETLCPITEKMRNRENFGLIWDIEHTHKPYGNGWDKFYSVFRPYIKHVHIKDRSDKIQALCLVGEGNVPVRQIAKRLIGDGYDGYFSLEWEKKWHPELPEIEAALDSFIIEMTGVE